MIGQDALSFDYRDPNTGQVKLLSIVLPEYLEVIGVDAFSHNELQNIIIPEFVTEISSNAFESNDILDINIPNSVIKVGNSAFRSNLIRTVNMGNSVTYVGSAVFNGNDIIEVNGQPSAGIIFDRTPEGLEDVTVIVSYGGSATDIDFIPNTVEKIGGDAFNVDNSITSVLLPEGLKTIGNRAFIYNDSSFAPLKH